MLTPEQLKKLKDGLTKGACSPETQEKIDEVFVRVLEVSELQLTPDARFVEDLFADSLDLVELTMAFEEEFGIDIPDEVAEKMHTVGDVYKYAGKIRR